MKEELSKTKKELEKEYRFNSKEIRKLKEKIEILDKNIIEGKFNTFCTMSLISFVLGIIGTAICAFVAPELIVGIGFEIINLFKNLFIGSIISGFILERIASKINCKKLNRFSNAKTDEQKREEILGYELEKEKLNEKNNAINKAYDFVSDLESKVDVCKLDFGNSNMTKEEQEENNKKLRESISAKERELEVSTTQEFINNKFFMLRSKMGKLVTIGTPIFIGGITAAFAFIGTLTFTPVMFMEATPVVSNLLKTICLSSGFIGTSVSAVATHLRRKQDRRIFNKINNRLDKNKLPENTNKHFEELGKIRGKKYRTIEELATAHLVYQDSTRELEKISSEIVDNEESALDIAIRGAKNLGDNLDLRVEPDERMKTIMRVAHEDKNDISWVQPYLEEDIEEDVVDSSIEGPTLVKRK